MPSITSPAGRAQIRRLHRQRLVSLDPSSSVDPHAYARDPVGYARDVLKIDTLWDVQKDILRALLEPPYRVLVPSGHDTGKTFTAAVAVNWWYDSFNPGVIITTAPSSRDVKQVLWAEIRLQRMRAITLGVPLSMDFAGTSSPMMYDSPEHWAVGYTSEKGEGYHGRHRRHMLFVLDEATGVEGMAWQGIATMFDPSLGHAQLCIFNPTSTTSHAYLEDCRAEDENGRKRWHRFRLSCLDHPNVLADLAGQERPVPGAVSLPMLEQWLADWAEPLVNPDDRRATDLQWPPSSGQWYKPGPIFQSRVLGIWPDLGDGVWSPALFEACCQGPEPSLDLRLLPEIGCDCATGKGDDFHAIHVRWGAISLHHETSNTMDPSRIFDRLQYAARWAAAEATRRRLAGSRPVDPKSLRIKLDDDGTGNAVAAFLKRDGYNAVLVSAGSAAARPDCYVRRRDELWFLTAAKAQEGLVHFGRLDKATKARLRQQLLAPAWQLDERTGRRRVETKDETKEKILRSPDDADAVNLAYLDSFSLKDGRAVDNPEPRLPWNKGL